MWCLMKNINDAEYYYKGKAQPNSAEAWTNILSEAKRFTWEQAVNMREWVSAHTNGSPIQRVKS